MYDYWDEVPDHLKTKTGWMKAGRVLKRGEEGCPEDQINERVGGMRRAMTFDLYSLDQTETREEATARRKEARLINASLPKLADAKDAVKLDASFFADI